MDDDLEIYVGGSARFMKLIRYFGVSLFIIIGLQACTVTPGQSGDSDKAVATKDAVEETAPGAESGEPPVTDAGFPPGDDLVEEIESDVPPHLLYKLLVAEIARQRGELDLAIDNYLDVAIETEDPKVAERATQIAIYAKEYDKALQAGRLWVDVEPDNADARRNLASVYLRLARPVDAVEHYEQMLILLHDDSKPGHGFSVIFQ